jgi:hypothetical protein
MGHAAHESHPRASHRLPGQVMMHARQLIVRLGADHPSNDLLMRVRQGILALAAAPSG